MSSFEHLVYGNVTSSYHNYSQICSKLLVPGWQNIVSPREGDEEAESCSVLIIITVSEEESQ